MDKEADDIVAVPMVAAAQKRFPTLRAVSVDKGFHSRPNQVCHPVLNLFPMPRILLRAAG
jgi:hypothetical protein